MNMATHSASSRSSKGDHGNCDHTHAAHSATAAVKDPVCGMNVDPKTAKYQTRHEGQAYFFCSAGCMEKFEATPEKYLSGEETAEPMP